MDAIHNARVHLFATALNNLGVGAIIASAVALMVNGAVGDPAHIAAMVQPRCRSDRRGTGRAREASHMSLETYWLVVPLAGIALTLPLWAWLLLTRHRDQHHKAAE